MGFLRHAQHRRNWGVYRSRRYGGCRACARCAHGSSCRQDPAKGRTIKRDQYEAHRERMRLRMKEEPSRSRYALRKQTVEPRIGEIRHVRAARRFLRRGLDAVRHERTLVCTAVCDHEAHGLLRQVVGRFGTRRGDEAEVGLAVEAKASG
ncbi:MAG: transposase [Planctomycetes bacterium]|nr:transposase [Planctomycetota bacterium]